MEKISGDKIYLRELTVADATDEYCRWLNDEQVNKYLETRQTSIEKLVEYIEKINRDKCAFLVGIFDNDLDFHIGNIKLAPIDWDEGSAVLGMIIGNKEYWGQGIGTQSTQLLVNYAFDTLGLNKIELGVIPENKSAVRVYEKVGFVQSGYMEDALDHDGVKYDKMIMTINKL